MKALKAVKPKPHPKNNRKASLLSTPVEHIDIKSFDARPIVKAMGKMSFTSRDLSRASEIFNTMLQDKGATSIICVQGSGRINNLPLNSPKMIGFYELTEDEFFITEAAAKAGVSYENTSETEPLVVLRYFGPETNPDAPAIKYAGNVKL